jgi:hypothetical protein
MKTHEKPHLRSIHEVRNMTRKEVINILGFPDAIYNKTTTKYAYCSQPDVGVGVAYS